MIPKWLILGFFIVPLLLSTARGDTLDDARAHMKTGRHGKAIQVIEERLKEHPEDQASKDLLLEAYRSVIRHNRFNEVIDITEETLVGHEIVKEGFKTLEQLKMPDLNGKSLVEMSPVKHLKKASDYFSLLAIYEKMGNTEELAGLLKETLKLEPGHSAANLKLAMLSAREGENAKAKEHFLRYIESGKDTISVLGSYARSYIHPDAFVLITLIAIGMGIGFLLIRFLGGGAEKRKKKRLLIFIPALAAVAILVINGIGWMNSYSFGSFIVLFAMSILSIAGLVLWVGNRSARPVLAIGEGAASRFMNGLATLFSGRLSGKIARLPMRHQFLILILIPIVMLSLFSILEPQRWRLLVAAVSGVAFFTVIGALALSFLQRHPSLAQTIKYLSFFNTIPFLLVFIYLAGGVADKFINLSFTSLDPSEFRTLVASLILFLFGLGFTMYLAIIQSQAILKPVLALTEGVANVEKGDFDVEIPVRSADELGILEAGFNRMVDGLRQRELIRRTFGKFVDPRVVKKALSDKNLDLGGATTTVVVLFSDIRGYTAFSETVTPTELVESLNEYFTRMVRVIEENGGLVNKFIGDAIMVVWGGLIGEEKDARRAIRAGLEMQVELKALNAEREARGAKPLGTGIGINSGEVIAGHIGSHDRLEWTVMGDTVNLAQRAESKALNGMVLVTPETFEPVSHLFEAEQLDPISVKGKSELVAFYSVIRELERTPAES